MNRPFLKTVSGKFVSRTVLLTLAIALVVGGLAIMSLRSLSGTANDAVANAMSTLPEDSVAPLEGLANDISSASSTLMLLLLLITVAGAVAAGALAFVFARQITSPIVKLRNAAMKSAAAMPAFVDASANGEEELPELPTLQLDSGDEVEDLAHSFEQVQHTAAELAIEQARVRRQNAERFVNLGRRSQNLLARQMNFIDSMEKDETNPANLQRLFQIDHLATRMRRNAESILVLADKTSPRRLRRPVSMHQVVQAASSEIEHFDRISISDISGASVDGSVATDLAHLLAELLENATSFAAPEAATMVQGHPTDHGYQLEIVDHGIGMEADKLAAANARFADESGEFDEQAPAYLGHDVVARLARRHGVRVELSPTSTGGLTARLHIPQSALARSEANAPAPAAALAPVADVQPPAQSAFSGHVEPPAPSPEQASSLAPADMSVPEMPPVNGVLAVPEMPPVDGVLSVPEMPPVDGVLSVPEMPPVDGVLPERPRMDMPEEVELPPVPSTIDDATYAAVREHEAMNDQAAKLIESAFPDDVTFPDNGVPVEAPPADMGSVPSLEGENPAMPAVPVVEDAAVPVVEDAAVPVVEDVAVPVVEDAAMPAVPVVEDAAMPAVPVVEDAAMPAVPVVEDAAMPAVPVAEVDNAVANQLSTISPLADAAGDEWAERGLRGLTPEQRAAIEWAIEKGGGSVSAASPGIFEVDPIPAAEAAEPVAVGAATELRAGPIDAADLAELETTPSGFRRRRRGEQGGEIFDSPPQQTGPIATPRDPEQLLAFRRGIESGRAEARSHDGDVA